MSASDILRQMLNNAPDESTEISSSISQIQDQIDDLTDQIDGVQNGLCAVAQSELVAYLDGTKVPELEAIYGDTPYSVSYGGTFGTIDYSTGNITDWQVLDSTGGVVYQYSGTHWDSDPYITERITNYTFGNDYLTRPLTSGATYGLIPAKTNLQTAKAILQENKDKIDNSENILKNYAS